MTLKHGLVTSSGKSAPGPDPRIRHRIQIGMFRPIRVDHTNCLQVAIKTHSFIHVYTWRSAIFSLFNENFTVTTLSFWRTEKTWILEWGKIINIFSFLRRRRRNFYFFFVRISVVLDKSPFSPFSPFLQTCALSVLLGSSRFPMFKVSVEAACAFAFSLYAK